MCLRVSEFERPFMRTIPAMILLLICCATAAAGDAPAGRLGDDVPAGKKYVYKESAGKPREMEVYFPADHDPAKRKVPGLLMFHGGGWSGGSLGQFRSLCRYLASRGMVAATAEYRMLTANEARQLPAGETRKRVCVTDAKSALRWFKQHADELGIDPNRVVTGGGSAGGHISVLATSNDGLNDPADPKEFDTRVVAYLLFNPAFSLDDEKDGEIDALKQVKPNFAPAVVMFGTNDNWKRGWDQLHAKLLKQGTTTTELWLAEGQPHGFFNRGPWQTVTHLAADRFLMQQGLLTGEPTLTPPATGQALVRANVTAQADAPKVKPNIVWFIVDDMSAHFSCYGETLIETPHVDRLAREGTRFRKAFVTAPVCSPCRSALVTGMYQTSIGAHHHRSGRGTMKIQLPDGVTPIPKLLQQVGYYTCIGSGLPNTDRRGKKAQPGRGLGKTDYNFEWDEAIYDANDWSGRQPGQPFFMQVQLSGGKLRGGTDASATQLLGRAKTQFGAATDPEKVTLPPYYPRDPVLLRDWAAYLDAVRFTDTHVGDVLARLESEGILDQTLVIFMTDHGISHARGKQFLYDEGTHVPLVVRGPGIPRGTVRDDLVEHIDLAAISLGAAGEPMPKAMQARDLFSTEYRPREAVFAARDRCDETVERIRSVRTDRFLYIRNFHPQRPHLQLNAYKDGKSIVQTLRSLHASGKLDDLTERLLFSPTRPAEELYEWTTDRWQVKNLATDPAHRETLASLRTRLDRWMVETNDHGPESEAMYDSDMKAYLGKGNPEVEANIKLMKQWAAEGK